MDESVAGRDVDMFSGLMEDLYSGALLHVMVEDFKNLVTWTHSHSTICPHIPFPEEGYRLEEVNTVVLPWNCSAGHAYNWPMMSLSDKVREAKKVLSETKKRKRVSLQAEEELEFTEEPADLSVAQEEGPAELDSSRSSLVTHVSGEHGFDVSSEQREVPTPDLPKAKTPKKKKPLCVSTGAPQEQASSSAMSSASAMSAAENSGSPSLPQILRLAQTALHHIELFKDDFAASGSVLDDSLNSMHLEDLGSDTDSAKEDELMNRSQSGGGDAASTTPSCSQRRAQSEGQTPSCSQRRAQSEGQLSPGTPEPPPAESPLAGPSTAPCSAGPKSGKKAAATRRKSRVILGSMCSLMSFPSWRTSTHPDDSRLLGRLALVELDVLLGSYLRYLWEGGNRHLTHALMVLQARCIDRHLKAQGCFLSMRRSPELPVTHQLFEEYCQALRERETDRHGAVICSVTETEEEELRRLGVLGRGSPEALLHLVLYNNIRTFGPVHLYRMWPVPAGKFRFMRVAPAEVGARPVLDCLEWVDPADPEQLPLRMLASPDDPLRCPLEDFRLYATKHTSGFLSHHDTVYSNTRSGVDLQSSEWYIRTPMSKLRMDKVLSGLVQRIETVRAMRGAMATVSNCGLGQPF
ncbi:uncharacterized protein LOC121678451 [Alosa sapidissima]|uniref:uncharacterized protein LOC121678451 n=1 Tax=Alosa sapidissima TaxID=34773 RepID=UPI001C099B11|nr:uncharacterized protein LOC121678451 [Alosa sapidissima]XP_041913969.1 uncharacterized protein LOC121678451 [Alosa sapidissima]